MSNQPVDLVNLGTGERGVYLNMLGKSEADELVLRGFNIYLSEFIKRHVNVLAPNIRAVGVTKCECSYERGERAELHLSILIDTE